MLESAVKLRKAFEQLGEEDIQYVNYFKDDENEQKRIRPPNFDDWDNAKFGWGCAKETDDVFSFGVDGGPSDDLEFGRFDVLAWWKNSLVKFPILLMVARDVFVVPVSTMASESAFSTGGRILDPFRSSLTHKIVEGLILTGNWLQATCPIVEPCVVQEHAQNEDESVHLLEHYINVETRSWNYFTVIIAFPV
ncbi:hypothetical protein EZV62_022479 [Acer yangbiense]|uniref:HAT C-terminal dimerisation domain-containing protein n=1 Tax=Acer yangbiense TaxID=1000413 RepID=A0A5C7H8H0_9ROSI|nr:hypothetical protein EZV62_022479 [Acer yangbiense]